MEGVCLHVCVADLLTPDRTITQWERKPSVPKRIIFGLNRIKCKNIVCAFLKIVAHSAGFGFIISVSRPHKYFSA